jgi:hypothetical protein
MFKFTLGVVTSAIIVYVLMNNPDLVRQGLEMARQQLAIAARNLSEASERTDWGSGRQEPDSDSTQVRPGRARALAAQMADLSHEQLWAVMDDVDFDRRAAAGQVLLDRAGIPASAPGIDVVKERYFRSGRANDLKIGFAYIGLLALQQVPEEEIVAQAQRFVERYPRHEACDYAVWALGELGSEEMIAYFFQIIDNPQKYGPAARERAFCCLAQCGRYSPARRVRMVPDFIEVYRNAQDAQTRTWSMQALTQCAPTAHARSIDDWTHWWSRQ